MTSNPGEVADGGRGRAQWVSACWWSICALVAALTPAVGMQDVRTRVVAEFTEPIVEIWGEEGGRILLETNRRLLVVDENGRTLWSRELQKWERVATTCDGWTGRKLAIIGPRTDGQRGEGDLALVEPGVRQTEITIQREGLGLVEWLPGADLVFCQRWQAGEPTRTDVYSSATGKPAEGWSLPRGGTMIAFAERQGQPVVCAVGPALWPSGATEAEVCLFDQDGEQLWRASVPGVADEPLLVDAVRISPSYGTVAVSFRTLGTWTQRVALLSLQDGKQLTAALRMPTGLYQTWMALSPNGRYLAVHGGINMALVDLEERRPLWTRSVGGREGRYFLHALVGDEGHVLGWFIQPKGTEAKPESGPLDLYYFGPDGNERVAWSPNGGALAGRRHEGGHALVWLRDSHTVLTRDGTRLVELTLP